MRSLRWRTQSSIKAMHIIKLSNAQAQRPGPPRVALMVPEAAVAGRVRCIRRGSSKPLAAGSASSVAAGGASPGLRLVTARSGQGVAVA